MAEKITRKDLFARIADVMKDDPEVVEMCGKYIEQLSKPRKPRVNKEAIEFAETLYAAVAEHDGPVTNKEMAAELGVAWQRTSAAFKRLVNEGRVARIEGENKSDPAMFEVAVQF